MRLQHAVDGDDRTGSSGPGTFSRIGRTGFTLIQLLIVITLVSVLVGWLLRLIPIERVPLSPDEIRRWEVIGIVLKCFLLWWVPPLILVRLWASLHSGGKPSSTPDEPQPGVETTSSALRAEVKRLGLGWWLFILIDILGVVFMPAR
jgi:hypothetical protein